MSCSLLSLVRFLPVDNAVRQQRRLQLRLRVAVLILLQSHLQFLNAAFHPLIFFRRFGQFLSQLFALDLRGGFGFGGVAGFVALGFPRANAFRHYWIRRPDFIL